MPQQVLLRQLTRKLRPGTLAGFWQGRYTLQPWNQVADYAYSQPPATQGPTWDAGADFGFAAHSHITNPSTGLDSIYQKHVWSRLSTAEPPESSDTDGQAQAKAMAAAAAFATLQPAAAAAAMQDEEEEEHSCRAGSLGLPAPFKSAALPAAILPSAAAMPSGVQDAENSAIGVSVPGVGLSAIPEEPEEPERASLATAEASVTEAAPPAAAESQGAQSCQALSAGGAVGERVEASSGAESTTAPTTQPAKPLVSCPTGGELHSGTAVSVPCAQEPAAASSISAGASTLLQCPSAGPSAEISLTSSAKHADRDVAAKQLLPLPVLTAPETPRLSKEVPPAPARAAMRAVHAVHAAPLTQNGPLHSSAHSAQDCAALPGSESVTEKIKPGTAEIHPRPLTRAHAPHSLSSSTAVRSLPERISRPVSAVACPNGVPQLRSHPRPESTAGELSVSRSSITAAADIESQHLGIQARAAAAVGRPAPQAAVPDNAQERRHADASAQAAHALLPAATALRPILAALQILLDTDTMRVSSYMPGLMVAQGEVCGRPVLACYLDTESIARSMQPAACRALCSMMDTATTVGIPVLTIHGSSNPMATARDFAASAATAAELADWMPAAQRHMDASGVVPHLAISLGQLSPISILLASASDYSFSPTRSFCHSGSCSGRRDPEQFDEEISSSSSSSSNCICKEESSEQGSSSIACSPTEEALHKARQLLAMLPSSNSAPAPKVPCHDPPWRACGGLQHIQSPLDLCSRLADAGLVAGSWAGAGTAVCFGRLDCSTVGFVAMPYNAIIPGAYSRSSLAQVIKAVRFCNAFSLPIVSVLHLHQQETATDGVTCISDLANLVFAYSEAAVPKLAVVCGPKALDAEKCLKSDVTHVWTTTTSKRHLEHAALGFARQCRSIRPEDTRAALCDAVRPLLDKRLVAVPKRKHALLPRVC